MSSRSRHDPAMLMLKGFRAMTKGERIAAAKAGILPPVRSERERQLRSRYGLLLEDYQAMLLAQGGVCAACQEPTDVQLYVDHDHETDTVRGLLCPRCNTIAGVLDDPKVWAVWAYLHEAWKRERYADYSVRAESGPQEDLDAPAERQPPERGAEERCVPGRDGYADADGTWRCYHPGPWRSQSSRVPFDGLGDS